MVLYKKYTILVVAVLAICACVYFAFGRERSITVNTGPSKQQQTVSSIAGLPCDTAQRRPVAVMMPSDPEARPLSGLGAADLVVEMPVTPDGITRFMAVFQCQTPKEIGSVRSAREDFIPLAAGFNSIYAHWGGEHGALDRLNQHIVDNINALDFDGTIFYRKPGIRPPHNGFTTLDLLFKQANLFGYDIHKDFSGYPHSDAQPTKNISNIATSVILKYPSPNNVSWSYDQTTELYSRSRGGAVEIDKNTGKQITARVVAVMHTTSHILVEGDQYIVVNTTGSGDADVYQNGIKISGTWKKDPSRLNSKLFFYDGSGNEIKFAPGQIWIEIDPTWQ
jgi:hypothetical protein